MRRVFVSGLAILAALGLIGCTVNIYQNKPKTQDQALAQSNNVQKTVEAAKQTVPEDRNIK